ncbi:pyruvate dehydrogenase complex dihydrolipoamide acetyltransferase [Candidatus Uabimicrobium amorphum]|uniref:Acetyltransferase component of pyruvate dehydrogenase complex n=1 Tax=Uabimicrobium amorphum TaxID=2596890 RepID=A0A5S9IUL1_UABAM|nr:pyruvate dehydrogenase complex dihydrolipoamide acetyltransferase [Candidatus Uabimicrobium amorphum]BBM87410.1 acetyltransferase component of pyruvatedehydrogenase complex [Candidatus Uabimicrobium amorphum]
MAEKIEMVALSPTMESGVIVKWSKKVGDEIKSGDVLCEVETDKATMEYESMDEGTLLSILVDEGADVPVGDIIAIIGDKGEDVSGLVEEIKSAAKAAKPAAAPAAPAPAASAPAPATPTAKSAPALTSSGKVKASPLARKMAQEAGIALNTISGSGPQGRIIKRDVEQAIAAGPATQVASTMREQVIPVSKKRQVIARRLAESKYQAPHYYLKLSINMENIIAARKQINAKAKEKLSMNAFIVKFVAEALRRHPQVNASWQGDSIVQFGRVDVGLAVAQPDGLITPVVRNCESKGIEAIDQDMKVLIDKALNNRLQPDEYTNATFTVSNLGSFGIEEFTAIINPPGAAILAIGKSEKTPIVTAGDQIVIKPMMKVSLSCDHRVIDGAIGAAFLKDLKDMMEDPIRTLL